MTDSILQTLMALRIPVFAGLLLAVMTAEWIRPYRTGPMQRQTRWTAALLLGLTGSLCGLTAGRIATAFAPVAAAAWAEQAGYGMLAGAPLPAWGKVLLSLLLLDGLIWAQHLVFHRVPILWRLHRVHHSDTEMDVTTAIRFHPLELLLSLMLKSAAAVILGIPPAAMALFEILLSSSALLTHANLRLPARIDALLRQVAITPSLHRIHHSPTRQETDSNYGFCLSIWDRLAGSLRTVPLSDPAVMKLGLRDFRERQEQTATRLLLQPFRKPDAGARKMD